MRAECCLSSSPPYCQIRVQAPVKASRVYGFEIVTSWPPISVTVAGGSGSGSVVSSQYDGKTLTTTLLANLSSGSGSLVVDFGGASLNDSVLQTTNYAGELHATFGGQPAKQWLIFLVVGLFQDYACAHIG